MNRLKKIVAGLLIIGAVAFGVAFLTPGKASAQIAYDPISSWIVLDGLFNRPLGYGYGYGLGYGLGLNNPIASWIVLDGLFGRGINDVGPNR